MKQEVIVGAFKVYRTEKQSLTPELLLENSPWFSDKATLLSALTLDIYAPT